MPRLYVLGWPAAAALLLAFAHPSLAQSPGDPPAPAGATSEPVVAASLTNVTRFERWSFFAPPEGGGDPTYPLIGNRANLGVSVSARRVDFQASFQYAQLLNVPRRAFGPGPLGPGGMFYESARSSEIYQLYFKSMSLRAKDVLASGLSIEGGRMRYESSAGAPSAGRLIGNAEWTMFERAFDGVRADYRQPGWTAHASFVMPTQGAFEESASPTMGKVQVATVSWRRDAMEVFAHHYRDTRAVRGRPDNTGRRADAADVSIQTFGGWYASRLGSIDAHVWAAAQRGGWYGDRHAAFSVIVEARHEWPKAPWRPMLGAGLLQASGDGDPNDTRHRTFFPMVPTTRPDVLAGTYAQMNLRDVSANVTLHPRDGLRLTAEVHRLSLVRSLDRWYSGTGATAFRGGYFGYSARQSWLKKGLGTLVTASSEVSPRKHWRLRAAAGVVFGGDIVTRQFEGRRLTVLMLESVVDFR